MALNCDTCDHKNNVVSQGHCTEFQHIPALDACAMHTGSKASAAPVVPATKPSGTFLWLNQAHSGAGEVKTPPPVIN